jgi:hypothetical protein
MSVIIREIQTNCKELSPHNCLDGYYQEGGEGRGDNPCTLLLVRIYISIAILEKCMEAPQTTKNRTTIWFSILFLGTYTKEIKLACQSDVYTSMFISSVYNSWKDMEAA